MKKSMLCLLAGALALSACNLQPTPTTTAIDTATPTLVTVDLGGPQAGSTVSWVDGSLLVFVPAGEFIMGAAPSPPGGDSDEDNPIHAVSLSDFWIYRTKVTNQQYALCVSLGICTPPSSEEAPYYTALEFANQPIMGVDWEQAQTYCNWLNARLPTEAEWEKTARGPNGNLYPWGDAEPACDLLNFNNCVGMKTDVTDYPDGKSYYEALDMAGNAFEWVADWYDPEYYSVSPAENPPGPATGEVRSMRGSSFESAAEQVPSAKRSYLEPEEHRADLGFRCVVTDPAYFAPFCQMTAVIPTPDVTAPNPVVHVCPTPATVTGGKWCQGGVPYTNVKVPKDSKYYVETGNTCTPGSVDPQGMLTLTCTGAPLTSFKIYVFTGSCSVVVQSDKAQCQPGYVLDPVTGMCTYNGPLVLNNAQCPAGYSYDPQAGCCVAKTGGQYPACPRGLLISTWGRPVCSSASRLLT